MRSMTSREIHYAIQSALGEVSRALASGKLDRSGRYYSDSELKERFVKFRSRHSGSRKREGVVSGRSRRRTDR